MPTINEMFPGRFLRGADLRDPVTVTIRRVIQERMYSPSARAEVEKWVVYFEGAKRGLVLNVTNAEAIAEVCGSRESEDWIGKAIVLYPEMVSVGGRKVPAVRVQAPVDVGAPREMADGNSREPQH